jgi:putative tricarboxylic transport membrane protein
MERALRQTLMMSQGDLATFLQRPMAAAMLALAILVLLTPLMGYFNRWRTKAIEG